MLYSTHDTCRCSGITTSRIITAFTPLGLKYSRAWTVLGGARSPIRLRPLRARRGLRGGSLTAHGFRVADSVPCSLALCAASPTRGLLYAPTVGYLEYRRIYKYRSPYSHLQFRSRRTPPPSPLSPPLTPPRFTRFAQVAVSPAFGALLPPSPPTRTAYPHSQGQSLSDSLHTRHPAPRGAAE